MAADEAIERQIFEQARGITDRATRNQYLDQACAADLALRQRIDALLEAHDEHASFLEKPAFDPRLAATIDAPSGCQPGQQIGPYRLLERIGEGGMGEVWVADQLEPIRRRVALKLIKPGMDTRSVLGRFEAERQALALMDHPNIARVLDAGTTPDQRPFFVMELVKGTPITEFCDARKLSPRERLELFIPVCQAIQHAHTKGIIHRDIKPSNVLVALYDEKPVPKVIDFGVAKAMGQQLTEKTIYTGFGALVGTPAYMAPEQATFNQLDVDTRADIYALGVLLYELLAGSPPVEPERLKKAALDEVLRLVRDEEPPRPSQRLSTSEARASIAAVRQSDPAKLSKLIQGELDWIVMKALEKDRTRRYDTANSFAADIQSYLTGDPVQAAPPSKLYRLRKFAHNHRASLMTVGAFVLLLLISVCVATFLAVQSRRAEELARQRTKESLEAQEKLEKSLEETRTARQMAERLNAEMIVSRVSDQFGLTTLLQWADRLPQISEANSEYREFLKLNLLGGLQFLVTYQGSALDSARLFPSHLRVHSVADGLLVFSRNKTDLCALDLKSGHQILRMPNATEEGVEVVRVIVAQHVILACDEIGRVHGFSRTDGTRRYTKDLQIPRPDELIEWQELLQVDAQASRVACVSTDEVSKLRHITILDIDLGNVLKIPITCSDPGSVSAMLSPDGLLVAIAHNDSSGIELHRTSDGEIQFHLPVKETKDWAIRAFVFAQNSHELAICTYLVEPHLIQKLQVWSLRSRRPTAEWSSATTTPVDFGNLRFLSTGLVAANDVAWTYETGSGNTTDAPSSLRKVNNSIQYADPQWLVTSNADVLRRDDLRVDAVPPSRAYSKRLEQFALAGRYLHLGVEIYDVQLQRKFPGAYWNEFQPEPVLDQVLCGNPHYFQMLLPTHISQVPDDRLQGLVRLAACGELDAKGDFSPWSEEAWRDRYRQAKSQGWLDEHRVPHLADYFQQPAFWFRRHVQRLIEEPAPPNTSGAIHREIADAWTELLSRDEECEAHVEATRWKSNNEKASPVECLSRELQLARKFGRKYWAFKSFNPSFGSEPAVSPHEMAYQATLLPEALTNVVEFNRRQRAYWDSRPRQIQPPGLTHYAAFLAEAFALTRHGEHEAALQLLEPELQNVPTIPPATLADPSEMPFNPELRVQYLNVLMVRAINLGELKRWKDCRDIVDRVKQWLLPGDGVTDWKPPLLALASPELLAAKFEQIRTQLAMQPPQ